MSPLIFIIVINYLERTLRIVALQGNFRFHLGCKSFQLSDLPFADNLYYFAKLEKRVLNV